MAGHSVLQAVTRFADPLLDRSRSQGAQARRVSIPPHSASQPRCLWSMKHPLGFPGITEEVPLESLPWSFHSLDRAVVPNLAGSRGRTLVRSPSRNHLAFLCYFISQTLGNPIQALRKLGFRLGSAPFHALGQKVPRSHILAYLIRSPQRVTARACDPLQRSLTSTLDGQGTSPKATGKTSCRNIIGGAGSHSLTRTRQVNLA